MGDIAALPSIEETQAKTAQLVRGKLEGFVGSATEDFAKAAQAMEAKRLAIVARHRAARSELQAAHDDRWIKEAKERSERFRRGVLGLWDRLTGQHGKLRERNEHETALAAERDTREKQILIERQLEERQRLQREIQAARQLHMREMAMLYRPAASPRAGHEEETPRQQLKQGLGPRL